MKRTALRLALIIAFTGFGLGMASPPAYGCSCIAPDPEMLLASSDAAFVGTLVAEPADPGFGPVSSADEVPYVFRIDAAYKGDLESPITVVSARSSASCGLDLRVDQQMALFVDRNGGEWHGSSCATMSPDAMLTGPFQPVPFNNSGEAADSPATNLARLSLGGITAIALVTAGAALYRRARTAS